MSDDVRKKFPVEFFAAMIKLYKCNRMMISVWAAKFHLGSEMFELMKKLLVENKDYSSFDFVLTGDPEIVMSIAENMISLKKFILHRASTGLHKLVENENFRNLVNYYFTGKKFYIAPVPWKKMKESVSDENFRWICNYFTTEK